MYYNLLLSYKLLLETLQEIAKLKTIMIRLRHYDIGLEIKKIEDHLLIVQESAASLRLPLPQPDQVLMTARSQVLFNYARSLGWRSLPDYIKNGLLTRKSQIDQELIFTKPMLKHFIVLNEALASEQEAAIRIRRAFGGLDEMSKTRKIAIRQILEGLTIECFLSAEERHKREEPFYHLTYPIADYFKEVEWFKSTGDMVVFTDNVFRSLPVVFIERELCFTFYLLLKDGFLAIRDLLKVSVVHLRIHSTYECSFRV